MENTNSPDNTVRVVDFNMPLLRMVRFMVKWILASFIAFFIMAAVFTAIGIGISAVAPDLFNLPIIDALNNGAVTSGSDTRPES
jgi:hypothetical protein